MYSHVLQVLYCRGAMVDVLTQSNCSRYTEFKAVQKIYRVSEGTIEHVPCSRADLFSSQAVSMLEKRRMMKFLTFCANYDSQAEAFQGVLFSIHCMLIFNPLLIFLNRVC